MFGRGFLLGCSKLYSQKYINSTEALNLINPNPEKSLESCEHTVLS